MKVLIVASLLMSSTASWGYNRSTLESIPSGKKIDTPVVQEIRLPASHPVDVKKNTNESKKSDHKQASGTGTG